jgi:hypothetical protein
MSPFQLEETLVPFRKNHPKHKLRCSFVDLEEKWSRFHVVLILNNERSNYTAAVYVEFPFTNSIWDGTMSFLEFKTTVPET